MSKASLVLFDVAPYSPLRTLRFHMFSRIEQIKVAYRVLDIVFWLTRVRFSPTWVIDPGVVQKANLVCFPSFQSRARPPREELETVLQG